MGDGVDTVLVPTDGSPLSREALEYATAVHPTAALTLLHVIEHVEQMEVAEAIIGAEELHERTTEHAEELLTEMQEHAADHHGPITTEYVFGTPADEIVEYADAHDVDLVVMGSHSRTGLPRVILGSVAQDVLTRAPVPVTVIR